jgi:hypothetical protein
MIKERMWVKRLLTSLPPPPLLLLLLLLPPPPPPPPPQLLLLLSPFDRASKTASLWRSYLMQKALQQLVKAALRWLTLRRRRCWSTEVELLHRRLNHAAETPETSHKPAATKAEQSSGGFGSDWHFAEKAERRCRRDEGDGRKCSWREHLRCKCHFFPLPLAS